VSGRAARAASTPADAGAESASARIADSLRSSILLGEIAPGDRVRQQEVGERLGASRLPVREALRILQAEGLVEHHPNKSARVPRLDMHEVDVMYRMRERLEPLALAESMPLLGAADLQSLEEIQLAIEADFELRRFLDLDRQFHLLTYSACRTEQLTSMVTRLWNSTQHYRRTFVMLSGPERLWVINAEHRLILDAIVRQDSTDAGHYLAGHIRRTRVELARHPEVFT
jgi:DNA-binding GntR family transcriptional regulator